MKKIGLICISILISTAFLKSQEPEQVYSSAKVYKPNEWYIKQAELWWKEIQKDKKNENAWYNYFMANRFVNSENDINSSKFLLKGDSIVKLVQLYIPNTFTGNYLVWRNQGCVPKNFPYLEKAYSINPNFYGINEEMMIYYETQCDSVKRKEFNKKWFKLNELSPGLLAYSYNVLLSIKSNGVILTFMDNDTCPLWMLQDALDIRKDVTILNISMLDINEYREKLFSKLNIPQLVKSVSNKIVDFNMDDILNHIIKNKPKDLPLYIGLPAWKQFKDFEKNLYLDGLTLEYSTENIDNIAILKNNFENKYMLDYISNSFFYDISSELVDRMNINYLPGIFKLYEHYNLSGDISHSQKIKVLGLQIAQKGGKEWYDKAIAILK